ncbi:MAG TPA: ribosome recycling factor [Syntrophales bacterium]|nr:ribosome recycling factor [Syntrophales bacterium]
MKDELIAELKETMKRQIQALEKSFSKVRTGRASLSLLDGIKVEYYGTPTPLNQVASLSVPESQLIVIAPWDVTVIGAVEKAIQKSELGLTPSNDGKVIRITIPPLTGERRKELVKVVKKMAEECRVKIRNARRDVNNDLKDLKKEGDLSEDELFRTQDDVQKITDEFIKKADQVLAAKEEEIMEI